MFLRPGLMMLFTAILGSVVSSAAARGPVSMYAIVAQPERFIGKEVIVSGVFSMDGVLGRGAIYLDEASYNYKILENSILLPSKQVLDDAYSEDTTMLRGIRVRVSGTLEEVFGVRSVSRLQIRNVEHVLLEIMRENR